MKHESGSHGLGRKCGKMNEIWILPKMEAYLERGTTEN